MTTAGPSLRLTALAAAAGTLLAVLSGSFGMVTAHRVLAELTLPPLAALVMAALVGQRRLLPPSLAALALFGAAALLTAPHAVHVTLAAGAFAAALVALVETFRGEQLRNGPWQDYVTLTKPRIMSLLLLTGACGMVVGAHGWPGAGRLLITLLGLGLACGGASALNHVLDADLDRLMGKRTETRPVAAGRVPAPRALEFGLALAALSFVVLASAVNVLTAALALVGNLFYVLVYTKLLKRTTPQNIVIGGAAGAVPPLVGWAAATGNLTLPALWLFLIVFLWTPPHFWALALLIRDGYAKANVPMLPVARGSRATVRQILGYSLLLVIVSAAPFVSHTLGAAYLVSALVLGGVFLALALRLRRECSRRNARLLFHYSLLYLALLFLAMAVDVVAG